MDNYRYHNTIERQTLLSTRKVLFAILSGVMLTASFPPGKLSFLAWFAIVPLLKSLERGSPFLAFKLGFIAGTAHYLTLIYWITTVLGHYGNLNSLLTFSIFLLLCFYLALYPALFCSLTSCLKDSGIDLVLMAGFWVSLEFVRAKLLTGFPWCLLGYTQYKHIGLIQIADLCGVYGLSFFIILLNGLIFRLFFKGSFKNKAFPKWETLVTALIAGGIFGYGQYCLSADKMKKQYHKNIKAATIQGNINQSVKWNPAYQTSTVATYQKLTRAVHDFSPDLIVWPETSMPFFFQNKGELTRKVFSLAKESGASLVFGCPAYKHIGGTTRYFNRAYLITPDNKPPKYYDKVHLVPFGEYVPLKKFLFFVNRLVPAAGDFKSGDRTVVLSHRNLLIGISICFEAIFPEIAREQARIGANILVNLTNDAWFGMTSAPYQHLSMAVFRAVENRRPMIRSANTGFSAFIGTQGQIIKQSTLFNKEVLKASIGISGHPLTFYTRFGDLFALSLLAISLIKILSHILGKSTAGRRQSSHTVIL